MVVGSRHETKGVLRTSTTSVRCGQRGKRDQQSLAGLFVVACLVHDVLRVCQLARSQSEASGRRAQAEADQPNQWHEEAAGEQLLDLVGLDTTMYVAEVMFEEFREARYAPPPLLKRMVMAGQLGRKTGKGFYTYPR